MMIVLTDDQIDAHQNVARVERIPPEERTIEEMASRFETFAQEEAGAAGMAAMSPTYQELSMAVASDTRLLEIARECQVGQPIPNLFLASVKRLIYASSGEELAKHYIRAGQGEPPSDGLAEAFTRFCLENEERLLELVRTRRVQVNAEGRCGYLMPAFGLASADAGGMPLALVDVGSSAGIHLLWDKFRYIYSDGSEFGPEDSDVKIYCETMTPLPDIPSELPEVRFRIGLDMSPIDMVAEEEFLWIMALIWPEHMDRAQTMWEALLVWMADPPPVKRGNALDTLPEVLEEAPGDAALCVFHCHVLNQFSVDDRAAFYEILRAESFRRPVYYIPSEGEVMLVTRIVNGESATLAFAKRQAHGRWVEWLDTETS